MAARAPCGPLEHLVPEGVGDARPAILDVLTAVRDQYLVELGEEALAQLRSPDESIRATATEAIDKLKFYAEAKKAFEK